MKSQDQDPFFSQKKSAIIFKLFSFQIVIAQGWIKAIIAIIVFRKRPIFFYKLIYSKEYEIECKYIYIATLK